MKERKIDLLFPSQIVANPEFKSEIADEDASLTPWSRPLFLSVFLSSRVSVESNTISIDSPPRGAKSSRQNNENIAE